MNYSSLLAEVYTLTKRPDLVAETALGVKSATLSLHSADFYLKDLYETGISFTSSEYLQTLDYKTLLPRWRSMKYLRKYDAVGLVAGKELSPVVIDKVLDSYAQERNDIYYLAGAVYQIKSYTKEQYYLLGAYLYPSIDPSNYISWIAVDHPYAIIYKAASIVFRAVGQDSEAVAVDANAKIAAAEITLSNIETVGS